MKIFYTLFILLISSYMSFAQSIELVSPNEVRRNQNVEIYFEGLNTQFSYSSKLTISCISNVDGSIIFLEDVYVGNDFYCTGFAKISLNATIGNYSVVLETSNQGKITKTNAFTVSSLPPIPEPISIIPNSTTNGELFHVTIKARYAHFLTATNISVYLKGNTTSLTADSIIAVNDTTLSAMFKIPLNSRSDLCYISIYSDYGYMGFPQDFIILGIDPKIVSITPDSANDGDEVDISIKTTKTSFMSASSIDVMLYLGRNHLEALSLIKVNDTSLVSKFNIPKKTRTSYCDVIIIEDNGIAINSIGGFTINGINPQVISVDNTEAEQGQILDVTITGKDLFFTSASVIDVVFNGNNNRMDRFRGTSTVVLNDNQIKTTLKIPASSYVGLYSIGLSVDIDSFNLYDSFTIMDDGIPDPQLVSITPNESNRGQVLDVIITGGRTMFTQSSNIQVVLAGVSGGYYQSLSTVALSDTQLKCTFSFQSNAVLGLYNVFIHDGINPEYLILADAFTLKGDRNSTPRLVSITPAASFPGQVLDVTITGANTHFMATSTTMNLAIFSQTTYVLASSYNATSNTTMMARFEIPEDFPMGVYDFSVMSTFDGFLQLLQSVIVNAVGFDEIEKLIEKLYPNPASEKLYIDTKHSINNFIIIDITGKQIAIDKKGIEQNNNQYAILIDKLGLRKGIYFIRLESSDGFDYQKFIVD